MHAGFSSSRCVSEGRRNPHPNEDFCLRPCFAVSPVTLGWFNKHNKWTQRPKNAEKYPSCGHLFHLSSIFRIFSSRQCFAGSPVTLGYLRLRVFLRLLRIFLICMELRIYKCWKVRARFFRKKIPYLRPKFPKNEVFDFWTPKLPDGPMNSYEFSAVTYFVSSEFFSESAHTIFLISCMK